MNADEVRIIGFLNEFPDEYVSVIDVSRKLGKGPKANDTKSIDFKQALKTPGVSLGDTTIIRISDVQEQGTASRNQSTR